MRTSVWAAVAAATLVAVMVSAPAEAAKKKRTVVRSERTVVVANRPQIVVRRRSFLDPGTEVLPGSQPSGAYIRPPHYYPIPVENTIWSWTRQPLPDPWDIPGYWRD
ncbi:MAG TPA: hypothetical protein VHA77_19195 [Xanthobacteraceae bacterium]|jgi:hypothetical protein|nr:hypothetical protein [Xanthobacteraceae bacterium]